MPVKLKRRPGRPHWYIHGTIRGVSVRESTGVADHKAAEAIRARREWEIIQRSVFGAEATATFVAAAVSYLEIGGERLYLKPIIARLGSVPLAKIDQALIEQTARALYPTASPATLNRQAFTPIAAVLNHAAKRGLCAHRVIERPAQPKGRVRWLTFEEAEQLVDACSPHLRPLVLFLLGTGARTSEALYLDWREVDLAGAHVTFLDTKNGEHRGRAAACAPRGRAPRAASQARARVSHECGPALRGEGERGRPNQDIIWGSVPKGGDRGFQPARLQAHLGDVALRREPRLDRADEARGMEVGADGAALRARERVPTGAVDRRWPCSVGHQISTKRVGEVGNLRRIK